MTTMRSIVILIAWLTLSNGFVAPSRSSRCRVSLFSTASTNELVVVSPPGGVGEVTAVKAAEMGSSVRWFVVSPESSSTSSVLLSPETLEKISKAGGAVEVAGADAPSLLLPVEDAGSAVGAVSSWCGSPDSIVCTFDGVEKASPPTGKEDPKQVWMDAVKIAAKQASLSVRGTKIAILPADTMNETDDEDGSGDGEGLLGSLFGGNKQEIPPTLTKALSEDTSKVTTLRHGMLFGTPESSPNFSPLVGGPRRFPVLCEEYANRAVRIDPTLSVSGNVMLGKTTRSSRHSVGQAAALMSLGQVPFSTGSDICVTSQVGTDVVPLELWKDEFGRVETMLSSGEGAQLFTADFASVPDVERLADWLNTKWAPAVLRTYDIAAIRTGARPVYAARAGEGKVEIVWQELINFESTVVGKMVIQVSDTGIVATRGPGDASKGYGEISRKPLNGEDVLVRTLSEASSQAVEKGLAKRLRVEAPKPAVPKPEPVVATSIASSGTVSAPAATKSTTGPRQAGARRSTRRTRGTKKD